jgi:hypothetical protein
VRPHVGDDTKTAAQQAAVLHLDISTMPTTETADSSRNVCDAKPAQQIGQLPLIGNDLRHTWKRAHLAGRPRRVTAHDNDFRTRIAPREFPNHLPAFRIPLVRHRARIYDAQLGQLVVRRILIPDPNQPLTHKLGLVLIDLATKSDGFEFHRFQLDNKQLSLQICHFQFVILKMTNDN